MPSHHGPAGGPGETVRLSEERRPKEKLGPLDVSVVEGFDEAEHKRALAANIKRLTVPHRVLSASLSVYTGATL